MKAKRRWRRVSDTEIGIGPWRGPAGAVTGEEPGKFHAEVWGREPGGRHIGVFAEQADAKRAVEAWLSRHSTPKRPHAAGKGGR